jgi:tRNA(Ile)-lysidine synthase
MQSIHEKMVRTIATHRLFEPGDRGVVAVSGGPDSVALLVLLTRWAPRFGLDLKVAHFNHQLRGRESDGDEQFVRQLAAKLGLQCVVGSENVAGIAKAKHMNLELAARECRYRFLRELGDSGQVNRVALGHTANDQAETFLMRLLRGAGTHGLASVYPSLDGYFVRPLLDVTRDEVIFFLRTEKLEWREDSSNMDLNRTRNRIRHGLLPELAERYNPSIVHHLARTAAQCRQDDHALMTEAKRLWRAFAKPPIPADFMSGREQISLPIDSVKNLASAIRSRVLRLAIQEVKGNLLRIDESHVEAMDRLISSGQSGDCLDFPGGMRVERTFEHLFFSTAGAGRPDGEPDYELRLAIPGEVVLPQGGLVWQSRLVDAEAWFNQTSAGEWQAPDQAPGEAHSPLTRACFDYARVSGCLGVGTIGLTVRNVRPGDRYQPRGSAHVIKVRDMLSEHRIPAHAREKWPLLMAGNEIIWARGCGESRSMAASVSSRQILVIDEVYSGAE